MNGIRVFIAGAKIRVGIDESIFANLNPSFFDIGIFYAVFLQQHLAKIFRVRRHVITAVRIDKFGMVLCISSIL